MGEVIQLPHNVLLARGVGATVGYIKPKSRRPSDLVRNRGRHRLTYKLNSFPRVLNFSLP